MFNDIIDSDSYMKTDIYEDEEKYFIEIDLPGFKREYIKTTYNHGYLSVQASKQESKKNYIKRERTYGVYKRDFYVGDVDYSKISAKYKDGVLLLEVLKNETKNDKKTIEIK